MKPEIANATSVSRTYANDRDCELLAVFQYGDDAEAFANMIADRDVQRGFEAHYIVADGYTGRVKIITKKPDALPKAAA